MKNRILTILCMFAAVMCVIYGILVLGTGSGTAFFMIWIAMAVFFCGFGISIWVCFWKKLPKAAVRGLSAVLVAGLVFFGCVEFMIAGQMNASAQPGLDYIIVLGAQVREDGPSAILKYRLDCAVKYLQESPETVCIVSGGQGYNEPFSEAEGMREYLVSRGISKERIIKEDQSKTTEENIINSMEYIEGAASVGVITNDFHVFRAMQIADDLGLEDASGIAAGSPALYLPNNMLREFLGEIKYLLF